jgi:predicted nucleic acid-binding protein
MRGGYYSRDPEGDEQGLNDFLQGVVLLGLDEETAKIFGQERGPLRATGLIIGDFDLLIGATALQYDLTLLTNNRQHFERIEGLYSGLDRQRRIGEGQRRVWCDSGNKQSGFLPILVLVLE